MKSMNYAEHEMEIALFHSSDEFAGCWDGSTYEDKTDPWSLKPDRSDS